MRKPIKNLVKKRKAIPLEVKIQILTESGYRCGVPTCRTILALDLHHMVEVSKGGKDIPENLLPLCPTCHALYHRGEIRQESIYAWKAILISLTRAFDVRSIDQLLFLCKANINKLRISGDGVLDFARLIGAGLVSFDLALQNGPHFVYALKLTSSGSGLIDAWISGDRKKVRGALGEST